MTVANNVYLQSSILLMCNACIMAAIHRSSLHWQRLPLMTCAHRLMHTYRHMHSVFVNHVVAGGLKSSEGE